MQFMDTMQAICWAEEIASKPNLRSQIGKLMTVTGGGDPVWDVALSISRRLADCATPTGAAMKAVYGRADENRDKMVGWMLGDHLIPTPDGMKKHEGQLHLLGKWTVKAERMEALHGQKYPLAHLADDLGIGREQLYKGIGWLALRNSARETLRQWLDGAEKEMELWLDERGWLYGGDNDR